MKKFILAAIAAASLFAIAPASAQTTSGMARSPMDANAQMVVVRKDRMMRRGPMGMERRMMRREMMRRDMRRMDRRMDRRRMMMR